VVIDADGHVVQRYCVAAAPASVCDAVRRSADIKQTDGTVRPRHDRAGQAVARRAGPVSASAR